jgi:membrane fusion protein, multidrug efflux system
MKRNSHIPSSRFLFVLACLVVTGCGSSAPVSKTREAPRVTVAHPASRSLTDEDDYNGWLEAFKTVDVRARVRGHITKVYFKDGDIVKKGQPLFDLDSAPFEVQLKQLEAEVKALEAQEVAARKEAERNRILIRTQAATQQDLEKSEADAQSFVARIAAKKAEEERCRLDLKYSKITADLAGKVSKAALTEGNLVNAGGSDPVLTTIVAIDPIYVTFNIDERASQRYLKIAAQRRDGKQEVPLRELEIPFYFGLDTEKGYPHKGILNFVNNRVDAATGTIEVRGLADNKEGMFVPGSRLRVRVPVSDPYPATLVPDVAVNTDQKQKYLLLVDEDKIVKRQNVELGRLLDDGMRAIQTPKLKVDAWIIVEGMERARLNYPVQPFPEAASATTVPAQ